MLNAAVPFAESLSKPGLSLRLKAAALLEDVLLRTAPAEQVQDPFQRKKGNS